MAITTIDNTTTFSKNIFIVRLECEPTDPYVSTPICLATDTISRMWWITGCGCSCRYNDTISRIRHIADNVPSSNVPNIFYDTIYIRTVRDTNSDNILGNVPLFDGKHCARNCSKRTRSSIRKTGIVVVSIGTNIEYCLWRSLWDWRHTNSVEIDSIINKRHFLI